MAKNKSGSFAIPFLITLLISLLLFGTAALYVYRSMLKSNTELKQMESQITLVSEADAHSILFVLDTSMTNDNALPCFLLYSTDPIARKIVCTGIPNDLLLDTDSGQRTVQTIYRTGGAPDVKTAVSEALSVTIDRYMRLDSTSFQKICNILGGVTYYVPISTRGLAVADIPQSLSAEQIEIMLTYNGYQSEQQRCSVMASAVSDMLTQCNGERVAESLETNFTNLMNLVSDTDITTEDFKDRKHAMKYILTNTNTTCTFLTPSGVAGASGFSMDERFVETLHEKLGLD